ncbi:UDP-N-acetylglucosamine pyrophosphorylase [Coemansia sp. RSA 2336]|nr:UDP-N-acetylglucosamine pyrophosphorylase [Coemansia sp. RSA 2336]
MVQGTPSFTSESLAALKQRYADAKQAHVFKYFDELDDQTAAALFEQLSSIDVAQCNEFFLRTTQAAAQEKSSGKIEPLEAGSFASTLAGSQDDESARWRAEGMRLIRENKVAVILLAGGQGTRLGSSAPKGCYDIGLPSHKSLFGIQAERIRRLQQLASDAGSPAKIPWLCGALVVPKKAWDEPVGVICLRNGRYDVVEYSEISEDMARMTRPESSELAYNAGNICNHYYTLDFLQHRLPAIEASLEHHIARKKIKHVDLETGEQVAPTKPNGIKLERFVFDVFPYVDKMAVLEVDRKDQFSPLKNAPGTGVDCPETSRRDLIAQCIRFVEAAGATVQTVEGSEPAFEISGLVSYAGEGLESLSGKTLAADQLITDIDSVVTV